MNREHSTLKSFIIISSLFHLMAFAFIPWSIFDTEPPSPGEKKPVDFYLVDYVRIEEEKPAAPAEVETIEKADEKKADEDEVVLEEIEIELLVEELEEKIAEEEALAEEMVEKELEQKQLPGIADISDSITPPPEEETIATELTPPIISSDLSDEYIALPALEVPPEEQLKAAFAPQEKEEEVKEEPETVIEEESEEPQLPDDPSLLVLREGNLELPKGAQNEGIEGTVELYVHVDINGNVDDIEFIARSGDSRIDNQAYQTIKLGWEFLDMPKPYIIHLKIDFRLEKVSREYVDIFFYEEDEE